MQTASISEAEQRFCIQSIQQGLRLDGRGWNDFRPLELELGLIQQASGSARLHMGATDVVVGVKAEVGSPDEGRPDHGRLQVTVECSPCASPEYEGRGGEKWGLQLAQALEASLTAGSSGPGLGLDLKSLSIIKGKTCWVLYVDAVILNDGGNVLDALSCASYAALANTRIPRVEIIMGEDGDAPEIELDDDMSNSIQLDVQQVPVVISVSQIEAQCVLDLSAMEEQCSNATLHIAVNQKGQVCGITKEGKCGVDPSSMAIMLEAAQKTGPHMIKQLSSWLASAATAYHHS